MRDILSTLETWRSHGEQIAIGTVIETWGSAPRQVGAKLAVTLNGGIAGSVSAGCVENAVIEAAQISIRSGIPRLLTFGVSKQSALDVGLTCGGTIRVFVEPFTAYSCVYDHMKKSLDERAPIAVISVLDGPAELLNHKLAVFENGHTEGDLDLGDQLQSVVGQSLERLPNQSGGVIEAAGLTLFADILPRMPRLIIVGAVHIAEFLVPMTTLAEFEIILVDPRTAFATSDRFPSVKTILTQWPDEALKALNLDEDSYVVVITHDQKIDDPALRVALASKARYVGALGSRRSNQQRLERLSEAGVPAHQLDRLRAPIGLPLGNRSTVDIAVSILAELVQVRNGAGGTEETPTTKIPGQHAGNLI
jgi:xanthine dehydrogenase accessory factor